MPNALSPSLISQLYRQESDVPFLSLVTLSHASFSTIRLVNNSENITSNGFVFTAFPMRIVLPRDDGESAREISIDFDNVGLDLITPIRTVTSFIDVKLEMVLASSPDSVQISFDELKIQSISYNKSRISAKLFMDNFLTTEMTSEKYLPTSFPGIF